MVSYTIADTEKQAFFHQIDAFYSRPMTGGMELLDELLALTDPYDDPFKKRELSYRFLAERLEIEVFSQCPFAFHYNNRMSRKDLDITGISYWYNRLPKGQAVSDEFYTNIQNTYDSGLAIYYLPVDCCHLTVDYETLLQKGVTGIKQEIAARKAAADDRTRAFYAAMESGLDGYVTLAHRFAAKALETAANCTGADKKRMLQLANTMQRIPEHPAKSFLEAMSVLVFMYYTAPALDGGNTSVLGHVDRLLWPYLEADLQNGVLTKETAFDLLWRFLYIPDCRWGLDHTGTNCTVTLGGCDKNGKAMCNPVTELILHAYIALGCIDPKLNLRFAKNSPDTLFELAAQVISAGRNNLCVFNDEVIVEANCKAGKKPEDARLYVAGGCQENVLSHCEQNSRATVYMTTPPALLGLWDDTWDFFPLRFCGERPARLQSNDDFAAIYQKTLHNLRLHITAQVNMKNISEAKSEDYCVSPAHSALIGGCIESGKDMYCGGAAYSAGSVSLSGIGTLIDSLLAIRWVVFDRALLPLVAFVEAVQNNFEGHEALRQRILAEAPKYGRDAQANEFAKTFFHDAATLSDGLHNTRGGRYEASLFAFRSFTYPSIHLPATPDGRRKGEYLSPSASPSQLARVGATDAITAVGSIDFTDFPVVAVTDIKVPRINKETAMGLIRVFLQNGGSVLQCNTVDQQTLLDARAHPERHSDLVVRVSGYSAHFTALPDCEQDEVIARICG